MASSRCIACAMLGLSPVLRSASASNPGAVVARVQNFGSLRGAVSEGFQQRAWRSDSGSGRSSSRSAEFLFHRLEGGRGGWIMNSEPGQDLNLVTSRGQGFVVGANGRWWNSLFELGDDGGIEEGPIELPPRELDIDPLAFPEASPAQIVASVALTGAIAVLLVRSLRRRAQRAKEMQFRSSGVATKESVKEDARKAAIANLTKAPEVPVPPPSPGQTILGAAVAGAIALVLYKFTTTVEGNFSGKAISMNYSVKSCCPHFYIQLWKFIQWCGKCCLVDVGIRGKSALTKAIIACFHDKNLFKLKALVMLARGQIIRIIL